MVSLLRNSLTHSLTHSLPPSSLTCSSSSPRLGHKAPNQILPAVMEDVDLTHIYFSYFSALRAIQKDSLNIGVVKPDLSFEAVLLRPPDVAESTESTSGFVKASLWKQPFLLASYRWGRFAKRNVCDSATEIPYWGIYWSKEYKVPLF